MDLLARDFGVSFGVGATICDFGRNFRRRRFVLRDIGVLGVRHKNTSQLLL